MGTKLIKSVLAHEGHESFYLIDTAGREIGFQTKVWECTYAEAPDAYGRFPPGVQFELSTHTTRDRKLFGAMTPTHYAATLERALEVARTKAATSRKRYAKLFPSC